MLFTYINVLSIHTTFLSEKLKKMIVKRTILQKENTIKIKIIPKIHLNKTE